MSTYNISYVLKSTHPEIEWRRIGAFRNVLVHDYLGIDIERIWEIMIAHLVAFIEDLKHLSLEEIYHRKY